MSRGYPWRARTRTAAAAAGLVVAIAASTGTATTMNAPGNQAGESSRAAKAAAGGRVLHGFGAPGPRIGRTGDLYLDLLSQTLLRAEERGARLAAPRLADGTGGAPWRHRPSGPARSCRQ